GTVIVNNAANITAAAGWGIDAYNFGSGNVTVNDASGTTVSGAQYGIAAYSESGGSGDVTINVAQNATVEGSSIYGILGFSAGTGSISITTSPGDLITGPSGNTGSTGVTATNEAASIPASSNSLIVVTTYGTINSGTALTGSGDPPAGITAGYLGGSTDPTNFPLTAINGSVVVNNFASITAAAGDGMRAYNYGIGNVTVFDDAGTITALGGASPTDGHGVGIGAYNYGTGNVSVSTALGIVINSGGSGINAFNLAPSAPANSTVSVVAHGTITSGSIPTGNGSPAAGILAGYNFNGSPDNNVAGSLIVDDYASISAPSGTDGIRGFNYGIGDITIMAESGAVISGGRYGIAAVGHDGGNVQINNSSTVSGATAGILAQDTGAAAISINNSSAGVIESSGSSSIPAISIVDDPTGRAVINNFGKVEASQNSAAGLAILETGGSVTINNSSSIVGGVNLSNAIINNNVGADWEFAGTNTFSSGVNIINNAGTINGQGAAGGIQISAGSLDIVGALSGTVDLAIGNAAMLELNGPASVGETVTFLGTQGTLKLDHSLTSPFVGQIANLTGTSLVHDNIDLADLVWTGTGSASYTANTATSGVLTVTDGSGHSEHFNLINYTGSGVFTAQSDGNGGTLVFDPPASSPLAVITTPSFAFLGGEASQHVDGAGPLSSSHFVVDPPGGVTADQDLDRPRDPIVDSKPIGLTEWHFAADQAKSNLPPSSQALTQSHEGTTGSLGNGAFQEIGRMWGHGGNDNFQLKPELGASNSDGFAELADSISLKHSAIGKSADFQAIAHPAHWDVLTDPSHHESAVSSASPHLTNSDHFSSYHLWA
ncbi:MAG: hypothetical protein WBF73_24525, partial [Bradyrhizobium sp.]